MSLYLLFAKDTVPPERVTTGGRIEGLLDASRRPHNIRYRKVTSEIQETILDLRLTKRFGSNRIKFRLKRMIGLSH